MKKLFFVLAVLLLSITATQAQGVYFPSEEGLIMEYANKNASDKVTGYIAYKFQTIERQDDLNFSAKYLVVMMDKDRKEKSTPIEATVKVVNGTVYFDALSAFGDAASALSQISESIVVEGKGLIIPADATAGQKFDNAHVTIGSIASSECSNITLTAFESLTTEAGTFETARVDMDTSAKVLIIKSQGKSTQWYTKGIGVVKTVNYNKNGKATSSMELVKISR